MAWFRCGNGGGSGGTSTERLIFNQYQFDEQVRIPPLDYKTEGRLFSEYLTYNSSTNQYEVIKAFRGLVLAWVYQVRGGSSKTPKGEFRVNGTSIIRYESPNTNQGSIGGEKFIYDFQIGDKFSSYNYVDNGYPKHAFKVFLTDMEAENMQFVDEDAE